MGALCSCITERQEGGIEMGALSKRAIGAALMDQHITLLLVRSVSNQCMSMSKGDWFVLLTIPLILRNKAMSTC